MTDEFETRLRAALAEHDADAPTVVGSTLAGWTPSTVTLAEAPPARPRRRPIWLAAAAAVLVVLVVATALTAMARHRTAHRAAAAPACPAQPISASGQTALSILVPAKPTVDTDGHLVPERVPSSAFVCAYGGGRTQHIVTNLAQLRDLLYWIAPVRAADQVRMCTSAPAVQNAGDYYLALSYPDGVVWVAAPGDGCQGSSNGAVFSRTNIANSLGASSTGLVTLIEPPAGSCTTDSARFGAQTQLVPADAVSVDWCTGGYDVITASGGAAVAAELTRTINDASTSPQYVNSCGLRPSGDQTPLSGALLFHYRSGPPTTVYLNYPCQPAVSNDVLSGTPNRAAIAAVLAKLTTR